MKTNFERSSEATLPVRFSPQASVVCKKSHYNSRVSLHEAPTKNDTLRWRTQGIFIAKGLKTFTIMKADWKTELFKLVTTDCQEELLSGCFRCHGSNQKIDLISKWRNYIIYQNGIFNKEGKKKLSMCCFRQCTRLCVASLWRTRTFHSNNDLRIQHRDGSNCRYDLIGFRLFQMSRIKLLKLTSYQSEEITSYIKESLLLIFLRRYEKWPCALKPMLGQRWKEPVVERKQVGKSWRGCRIRCKLQSLLAVGPTVPYKYCKSKKVYSIKWEKTLNSLFQSLGLYE